MPERRQVAGSHRPGRASSGRSTEKSAADEAGKASRPQSWRGWNVRLRIISGIRTLILESGKCNKQLYKECGNGRDRH